DRNRSHWSTSKTPSYTKSVSWQHHRCCVAIHAGRKSWEEKFGTEAELLSQVLQELGETVND
ncbi:hypothetical protein POW17_27100, partial [Klebsiella pneumoniae]